MGKTIRQDFFRNINLTSVIPTQLHTLSRTTNGEIFGPYPGLNIACRLALLKIVTWNVVCQKYHPRFTTRVLSFVIESIQFFPVIAQVDAPITIVVLSVTADFKGSRVDCAIVIIAVDCRGIAISIIVDT